MAPLPLCFIDSDRGSHLLLEISKGTTDGGMNGDLDSYYLYAVTAVFFPGLPD